MIRIVDLTHHVAGPFATLLLAELGADVIKVERPDRGDPWRQPSATADDGTGFDYLNRRKRSVTLDLKRRAERRALLELVAGADAVVENFAPGVLQRLGLSLRTLRRVNPTIVLTSISNFGQTGPRRDWQASEIVLQAMGGIVQGTGWEDGPPQQLGGHAAEHCAGLNAAIATLASIHGVRSGTTGSVHNDVAIQESFAAHWARHISQWVYSGTGTARQQRGGGAQGFPPTLPAQDGYLYILALRAEWESFAFFLGLEEFVGAEWSDPAVRRERWPEIDPFFRQAIAARGRYEWFAAAAEHGYTFAPADDALALLDSPQLAARGFFRAAELLDGRSVDCPTLPFSGFDAPVSPNRAPKLGEHNAALQGGSPWLG
jgi:crotonobetainyl-CoA:carnitine CoA-transferase CaiB-like acyl-CoA transferase